MKFRILLEKEKKVYVAECPTLPGCISQGKSRVEAIRNIREAIRGYITSLKKHNKFLKYQ